MLNPSGQQLNPLKTTGLDAGDCLNNFRRAISEWRAGRLIVHGVQPSAPEGWGLRTSEGANILCLALTKRAQNFDEAAGFAGTRKVIGEGRELA